ncbi:hypothetical protein BRARA_F00173 [Brassica rapa]|uniref:Uncharacterized protein n=1 Tax=Brassica campestris TaxID=3711 RepID=A0A397YVW1_BRACM|nr:hypothetical protein BRARA_F00173 [Brassica rapa]
MSVSKSTRDLSLPHASTCLPQCRGHRFTDQEVDPDDCVAVKDWWFNTGFHSASDSLSTQLWSNMKRPLKNLEVAHLLIRFHLLASDACLVFAKVFIYFFKIFSLVF